jgi:hypothetical protein
MRILPLLAMTIPLGLALPGGSAQGQLAQFCNGRISLTNMTLDPRSVSDARRPWFYLGYFTNGSGAPVNTVLTFVGPAGTISQANGRALTMAPGQTGGVALVHWPKSMSQPGLGTVATGIRVDCP